jgi:hypothetical protein
MALSIHLKSLKSINLVLFPTYPVLVKLELDLSSACCTLFCSFLSFSTFSIKSLIFFKFYICSFFESDSILNEILMTEFAFYRILSACCLYSFSFSYDSKHLTNSRDIFINWYVKSLLRLARLPFSF